MRKKTHVSSFKVEASKIDDLFLRGRIVQVAICFDVVKAMKVAPMAERLPEYSNSVYREGYQDAIHDVLEAMFDAIRMWKDQNPHAVTIQQNPLN